jgi:hypothetical protein
LLVASDEWREKKKRSERVEEDPERFPDRVGTRPKGALGGG